MLKTTNVFVQPGDRIEVKPQGPDHATRLTFGPNMDDAAVFFMDRSDAEVAELLRGLADVLNPQGELRAAIARKCEAWDWVREHAAEAVSAEVLRRERAESEWHAIQESVNRAVNR